MVTEMAGNAWAECIEYASRWERIHKRQEKQRLRNEACAPTRLRKPATRWHGPGGKPDALGNLGKRFTGHFCGYSPEVFELRWKFIAERNMQFADALENKKRLAANRARANKCHQPVPKPYQPRRKPDHPNKFLRFFGHYA